MKRLALTLALVGTMAACTETPADLSPESEVEVIEHMTFDGSVAFPNVVSLGSTLGTFDQGLSLADGNGLYGCGSIAAPGSARAQTFVPTLSEVVAVQLWLIAQSNFPDPTLRVSVHDGPPTGSELGFMTAVIPATTQSTSPTDFIFPSAIAVTPGQTYSIVVQQVMPNGQAYLDGNVLPCSGARNNGYVYAGGDYWSKFSSLWTSNTDLDLFFATYGYPIPVSIEIKPGSDPNSINPKSNGVVPVAILGSATFDVADVDVTTLAFGPAGVSPRHDLTDPDVVFEHTHEEVCDESGENCVWEELDVNGDGFADLVSHYRQKETGLAPGNTEACITGSTLGGVPIEGCDAVRVLDK